VAWRETSIMDGRVQFIADFLSGGFTMSALCDRYGISRPTGYKWVSRYQSEPEAGLGDRSRRPHVSPHQTPRELCAAIVALRRRHPDWGARKLIDRLRLQAPDRAWPAASTAHVVLQQAGLIGRRRRRPTPGVAATALSEMTQPNAVWTIDFKGQFRTRDRQWCYPLTVMDGCTRYLLACQALPHPTGPPTRTVLERTFREYGLPERIRSDNGPPFACACALARLSPLAVWWIKLGIVPERIQPGRPAQNGRHERMHRTLKRATTHPPAGSLRAQQRRFNRFRAEYNEERPHVALGALPPTMLYVPSARSWADADREIIYPPHFDQRPVTPDGAIKWRNRRVWVSVTLAGEDVGIEEIADGEWGVYFGPVRLGTYDERMGRIRSVSRGLGGRSPAVPARADRNC